VRNPEPCPGDPSPDTWFRSVVFLLSLTVVLTAIASIMVAWWGVAGRRQRPRPFLIGAASGLALSVTLSVVILVVLNTAGDC
jgi:hypothetical protein